MHASTSADSPGIWHRPATGVGVILLVIGLLGHVFAARAIGGSYIAYRDHIAGFFIIGVVLGLGIGGLGWRFWKQRSDISIFAFGALQAAEGVVVYIDRFHVHG